MQIDENHAQSGLRINACAPGCIDIDGVSHHQAVCLNGKSALVLALTAATELRADDFQAALHANPRPEVVLVGTGVKQVFLHPRISAGLLAAGIGVEIMSTAAACRTYMILHGEGRPVWAWLWP